MNKRKITRKRYRTFVNWFIYYLRIYTKVYKKTFGVKCPFEYSDNGKRFYP